MTDTVDFLLAQIALKIQLSRTKWDIARERYETIAEYLEADGSLLKGRVRDNYPQGSVRIQSAIASRGRDDQHDIDFITELTAFPGDPNATIEYMFRSLDRGPGSRYHGVCELRNRCVTMHYSDMHLDVTPAVRAAGIKYRGSLIPDRRLGRNVIANPEGFAIWFEATLPKVSLAKVEARKAEPVEHQKPAEEKPVTLLGLQLNKRWRSIRHEGRTGRKVPSVVLAKLSIDSAGEFPMRRGLLEELTLQCAGMIAVIQARHRLGQLVYIENPECAQDILTDRWPGNLAVQEQFLGDLRAYAEDLAFLRSEASMEAKKKVLTRLFGEAVITSAYDELAARMQRESRGGGLRHGLRNASVVAPTVLGTKPSVATPTHGFFGGRRLPIR